jgi:hypothetical protein
MREQALATLREIVAEAGFRAPARGNEPAA